MITRVPEATQDEMDRAVDSCKEAFKEWSQTTVLTRQQMMFKLQQLIKTNLVMLLNVFVCSALNFNIYIVRDLVRNCNLKALQMGHGKTYF